MLRQYLYLYINTMCFDMFCVIWDKQHPACHMGLCCTQQLFCEWPNYWKPDTNVASPYSTANQTWSKLDFALAATGYNCQKMTIVSLRIRYNVMCSTVQASNYSISRPVVYQCLVVQAPTDNMSKYKRCTSVAYVYVACESKLRSVLRSPLPGNWVAIERAVGYNARAACAFSAGIKCWHCICTALLVVWTT